MDTPEIRLGLIGSGSWGRAYIRTIRSLSGVCLARLCTSNPESRRLVPHGCQITSDWRAVAEADDLDGVIVATPPQTHAQMVMASVQKGLPVMVGKPLTVSLDQANALHRAVVSSGVPVLVDHTQLFHPAYRRLKELASAMGRIRAIRSIGGQWRAQRHDVSPLWDYGPHDVALSLDFMGRAPVTVKVLNRTTREVEGTFGEVVTLELEFPEGIISSIMVGNAIAQKRRLFAVEFDEETLVFDDLAESKLVRYSRILGGNGERLSSQSGHGKAMAVADGLPLTRAVEEFVSGIRAPQNLSPAFGTGLALEVTRVLAACEGESVFS